jgi:AcrR family transcriptional regulator
MDARRDRGDATRRHIVATATRLFTEQGYEAVSIEAVLKACAISRGALYHHFPSKEAVFTAVLEAVEARIAEQVSAAGKDAEDGVDALRRGARVWLDLAREDAAVRRIVLVDAPAAIGWEAWRRLDEHYSLGLLRAGLAMLAEEGRLAADKVDTYAHILLAVLVELALLIARSPDDADAVRRGREAVDRMLDGLLARASDD